MKDTILRWIRSINGKLTSNPRTMRVFIISDHYGVMKRASAILSAERGKPTVYIKYDEPVSVLYDIEDPKRGGYMSTHDDFYLKDYDCAINIWGCGNDFPNYTWRLHPEDATFILKGGGG